MCIDKRNAEGYWDPTASMAIEKIEAAAKKPLPMIYICSPYRENPRVNVMRARQYCQFAVEQKYLPLAPHLYFPQFMAEERMRSLAFRMNFQLMEFCEEVWVFGEKISEGMKVEIAEAYKRRLRIRHFTRRCEEVM